MNRNDRVFWVMAGLMVVVLPAFVFAAYQRWRDRETARFVVRVVRAISDELDGRTLVVQPPATHVAEASE